MNLSQIGKTGLATGKITVPDEFAGVSVSIDAEAFHQQDVILLWFAETMTSAGRDRDHVSIKREAVRPRHQATNAGERRF